MVRERPRSSDETIERLDRLREDGQTYDELVEELVNIYETVERSLVHGSDGL